MSFLNGLKNIGKFVTSQQVVGLATVAAQLAPIPGVGMAVSLITTAAKIEARHADNKDATGAEKAADFMADYLDGVTAANIALATQGKMLKVDEAKIAAARDAIVNALNLCRDAQQATHLVDIEP